MAAGRAADAGAAGVLAARLTSRSRCERPPRRSGAAGAETGHHHPPPLLSRADDLAPAGDLIDMG
jgi:hypothetical protein